MLLLANPDLIIPSQFPFQMNFSLFFYSHEIKCNVDQIDRSALNINHVMSKEPIQETIQTTTLQNVFPVTKFTSTKVITRKKKSFITLNQNLGHRMRTWKKQDQQLQTTYSTLGIISPFIYSKQHQRHEYMIPAVQS